LSVYLLSCRLLSLCSVAVLLWSLPVEVSKVGAVKFTSELQRERGRSRMRQSAEE
jgi:hypothetical protein